MRAPEFWDRPRDPRSVLLLPAAGLYGLAGRLRRAVVRPHRAPVPVICVGALTVGGAGKTPVAIAVAEALAAAGHRPHFLTRGYGGAARGPLRVDLARHDAAAVGDEALLLAQAGSCWVARDRVAGARAAAAAGAGALVMDDGFQNPTLAKDAALLVVDGAHGIGNGHVLPAGPLRECVGDAVRRANAIVLLGADETGVLTRLAGPPVLKAQLAAGPEAAALAGRRVFAFAGIGRPQKFFATLRAAGAEIAAERPFPDHHAYSVAEVKALLADAARLGAQPVTTAKDAVRIPRDLRSAIGVLTVHVAWHDRAALESLLVSRINAVSSRPSTPPA